MDERQGFLNAGADRYRDPRRLEFVDEPPKTVFGNIWRAELQEREEKLFGA